MSFTLWELIPIKRLIAWLYERYAKEPEYTPTLENRKRYLQAKFIENEFRGAGYTGKPKPDYPKVNGEEPPDFLKKHLDQIYDNAYGAKRIELHRGEA